MGFIPIPICVFIISLIGCIFLSIFHEKLKLKTITIIKYILAITTIIGIFLLCFDNNFY